PALSRARARAKAGDPRRVLHVTSSNSLERLATRVDALLGGDPLAWALEGRTVFVPDRVCGAFLLDALARARGVCAGVATPSHAALGERVAVLAGRTLLDAATLRALLLDLLLDASALAADELNPVRAYLADAPDRALWALQLAERLAALFLERARRPAGERAPELPGDAETLRWQAALHARIFGPEGTLARLEEAGEGTSRTLAALAAELDPAALALPPELTPLLVLATRALEPDLRALLLRL